jgi:hypothetical protein
MGIVWRAERGCRLLRTAKPDVVWNGSEKIVPRVRAQDGPKPILEIISATSLKTDTINIKPCSPKESSKPIHVTIYDPASVVSEA